MKYFVSVEQIEANILFYMQKIFTTERNIGIGEEGGTVQPDYLENTDSWKMSWTPVIWRVEELEITVEDCMRHVALLPIHKKLRVIEGPVTCMNEIVFDDGTEVFDTMHQARTYVIDYVASRLRRFNDVFNRGLADGQRL